jgi:YidC/Oxa1 family membrane protein insertase
MDIKTLFLYAAFGIVTFNLWTDWKQEHTVAAPTPSISIAHETQQTQPLVQTDETTHQIQVNHDVVHVKTDVLDVQIDLENGDVTNASLLNFSNTIQNITQPFTLFQKNYQQQYYASTHFVILQGQQPENVAVQYSSPSLSYQLQDNQNQLLVELKGVTSSGYEIRKVYRFDKGSYVIQVNYDLTNNSSEVWKTYINQQLVWQNPVVPESSMFQISSYTGSAYGQPGKHRYKKVSFDDMKKQNLDTDTQGGWIAMQQHYFLTAWIPNQKGLNRFYTQFKQDKYTIGSVSEPYTIQPNQTIQLNSQLYVGPEDTAVLKQLSPGLDLTVDYGWLWFLSDALFSVMKAIEQLIGNWGWSIVLITLLIKLMFYRLSASSYRSMANMRRLQPKLEQLKQRFGDDKAKFSQATMELYKQEKVNPLGGCLPIVIQIPVFIALYWVLVESVELRQAPFIFWIKDLSAADPYHVLPLIMGLTMLIQQKLNPAPPDPAQAKVMMLMPIFFTMLFWGFPSGLVLYWIVNNTLSILQQWWITRKYQHIAPAKG